MISIDYATSRYSFTAGPGIVLVGDSMPRLVALIDGHGSWGAGVMAALLATKDLSERWSGRREFTLSGVIDEIAAAIDAMPEEYRTDTDVEDWGFSLVCCLVGETDVELTASGCYEVCLFRDGRPEFLYRPVRWVDKEIESGRLTMAAAATHPFRFVLKGPWAGMEPGWRGAPSGPHPLPAGARVVVANNELIEKLTADDAPVWVNLDAREVQEFGVRHGLSGHPVIVLRGDSHA